MREDPSTVALYVTPQRTAVLAAIDECALQLFSPAYGLDDDEINAFTDLLIGRVQARPVRLTFFFATVIRAPRSSLRAGFGRVKAALGDTPAPRFAVLSSSPMAVSLGKAFAAITKMMGKPMPAAVFHPSALEDALRWGEVAHDAPSVERVRALLLRMAVEARCSPQILNLLRPPADALLDRAGTR
jgi:hypothetical protein